MILVLIFILSMPQSGWADTFADLFTQGLALHKTKPLHAIALFEQALAHNPHSVEIHYNVAYVLKNIGHARQALPHYDFVLSREPGNVGAHIGKAQALLMLGQYENGWKELEWRLGNPCRYTQELVDHIASKKSLRGKRILIHAEWGIGDTLMFMRYAQLLHEQGAYVMIHLIHQSLVPLLKLQPYFDEVIGPNQPAPLFHFQIPLVSLPILFATIPSTTPYISINHATIGQSKYHIPKNTFSVGICWHGNIIHGEEKFMPLEYFLPLAQISGVTLYSLQRHHGMDQLNAITDPTLLHIFDNDFDTIPFFDTIAVMKQLNLIITVDTSIAHLAGALNLSVWLIVPEHADWRWLQERTDSPFYPSMRIFRQKKFGDWQAVIKEIQDALAAMVREKFIEM